ncbi:MAG: hypothetical protein AB7S75_02720 [Desulfococcaceae bacterium]
MNKDNQNFFNEFVEKSPNESIILSKDEVIVYVGDNKVDGVANVTLNFIPNMDFIIEIKLSGDKSQNSKYFEKENNCKIQFVSINKSVEVIFQKKYVDSDNSLILQVRPHKEPLVINCNKKIYKLDFLIFNFLNFKANSFIIKDINSSTACSRLNINAEEFNIIIESHKNTYKDIEALKNEGGFAITHLGRIEYQDQKTISNTKANEITEAIFNFFSFVRGNWTPILPIGIGQDNDIVWKQWGIAQRSPWQDLQHWETWFDYWHVDNLDKLFESFFKYWEVPIWKETIKFAIYWYIHANTQRIGADGSIFGSGSAHTDKKITA